MARTGKRGQAKLARTNIGNVDGEHTLEELFNIYMFAKKAEGLAKSTLDNKAIYYRVFTKYLAESHNISLAKDLTLTVIREAINYFLYDYVKHENNSCVKDKYKVKGVSDSYVNTIIRHMRAFFNFLVDENYVDSNPFKNIKQIKETSEIEAFTMEQVKLLLKQPDQRTYAGFRDYVMMFLLLDTGMRVGEVIQLVQEDIDFKTNTIHLKSGVTKSRKTRYIPFSQKTNKLLRELVAEIDEFSTPNIFTTVYGNPIEPARFRQRIKKYGTSAGITGVRVSPHTFRHTFAKYYLLNDGDIMTLQKIMGHTSVEMVKRYVNMTDRDIINQHNKFSPINNI